MTEKRPLTFTIFFLRLLSGFIGGVAGTLMAFVVYFLMANFIPARESNGISTFTIIVISFVATLTSNASVATIVSFMDSEKYGRRKTMLTHVFVFNLILFFLTIPIYGLGVSLDIVSNIAGLHFMLSAFITAVLLEILAGEEYALMGVYSNALGIFISLAVGIITFASGASELWILFGAMPFTWLVLQINAGFVELVYTNFLRYYGLAALSTKTDLGGDLTEEKKEEGEEDEDD